MISNKKDWLEKRYYLLLEEFKDREFDREEVIKVLTEKSHDYKDSVPVILTELKNEGYLNVRLDPKDSRKRLYTLKSNNEIIKEKLNLNKEVLTRQDIDRILKKAADLIRTRVDYKFILILLFLKRISDKWEEEFEHVLKDIEKEGLSGDAAINEAKRTEYHKFDLPEEYLWDNLRKEVEKLPEKFSEALKNIAERNPELRDALENTDFIQFTSNNENAELLRQLVELFSEKKLHHVSPDILGDAYEWILRYFAPDKAKEGEVYTPREVIQLIVEILKPLAKESVYDPTCGSSGMLISSYKYVEEKQGKEGARKLFLFGQEYNPKTLALGRMNMYIHDIRDFNLQGGDTLIYPRLKQGDELQKFNIVIANPPWNQDGYDESRLKQGEFWKTRFKYGFVPGQSADWAWIQHMLASSKDDTGRIGVVMDNGCLFRSGKEKAIRQRVIEEDLIEAVLLLPEKLFYNTGAPGAIIILRKNKPKERKGKILFINASNEYEKHPDVRKLNTLTKENMKNIVHAYDKFEYKEGFSRVVDKKELKENDFNLNVSLYIYPEEEHENIDVHKEWSELKTLEKERGELDKKIELFLKEIK
ncbi:MAG: class I SAM-dependent DNA methyltransferase [Candidatus Nanoarchaeia archaeon]